VMERLKALDHVAYIRFASVYRDFTDITMLKLAVDSLVSSAMEHPPGQLPLLPDESLVRTAGGRRRVRR
jgi:transcriptional repressor NrdR